MFFTKNWIVFILSFLISFRSEASLVNSKANVALSVESGKEVGNFPIGMGSVVNLKSADSKLSGPSLFLGNVLKSDGNSAYQIYLNKKSKTVYYIESNRFSSIPEKLSNNLQTILDPTPQAGGTCTGYAIYNFLVQTHFSGFTGSGELQTQLQDEESRQYLMVDAVNQYYLTPSHKNSITGILNGYGKKYGFNCKKFQSEDYSKVLSYLKEKLKSGSPVIVSFNIGPKMYHSPFKLKYADPSKEEVDDRLWIPRKSGERNSGGHSIVASSFFELNNRSYMVMIDSDWSEPRVWDVEDFLNTKTMLLEMEFISCH